MMAEARTYPLHVARPLKASSALDVVNDFARMLAAPSRLKIAIEMSSSRRRWRQLRSALRRVQLCVRRKMGERPAPDGLLRGLSPRSATPLEPKAPRRTEVRGPLLPLDELPE